MRSTVDALLGQLFITGLEGLELDGDFEAHHSRCPCGGFIVFGRNVRNAAQVRGLTAALSRLASRHGSAWGPPLIAVDQEGGMLSPLREIVTSLPGSMGLAATGDPEAARDAGFVTGQDLLSLGVNVNLAPVLDLAADPLNPAVGTRSFGDDPHSVARFGVAYASGLLDAGVLFVAKHFPGHGSVSEDSHTSLPECDASRADLVARDVVPFIETAKLPFAAMMVAHIRFRDLDPVRPASLSRAVVTGLLRGDLGFDGVVLTDCLEMGGVRQVGSVPEAAVMAIEAGCDIVLVSHTRETQEAAFEAVRDAVLSGRISIERVERSVGRIRAWKDGLAARERARPRRAATRALSLDDLGERVITLVEGDPSCHWSLGPGPLVLVTPAMDRATPAEDAMDVSPLAQELERYGVRCARVSTSADPDFREIDDVLSRVGDSWRAMTGADGAETEGAQGGAHRACPGCAFRVSRPRVALVVRDGGRAPGQSALAAAIEAGCDLLLIGIRDPRETRPVQAALARPVPAIYAYSTEPIVLSALARVLAGKASPKGVIPVRL